MPAVYNKIRERGLKPVFRSDDSEAFVKVLDDPYTTDSSDSYVRDVEINVLFNEMIGLLFAETAYEEGEEREITTGVFCERIDVSAIKSYIDTHYQEPLSMEVIADYFHFNKNYMARIFKDAFGVTVNGYIQLERIGKVKELLRFTSMSIEQISYESDFDEQANYLSRIFKKVEGCSPSEFRRNWMSGSTSDNGSESVDGYEREAD